MSAVYCSLSHSGIRAVLSFELMQTGHLLVLVIHSKQGRFFCEALTRHKMYLEPGSAVTTFVNETR